MRNFRLNHDRIETELELLVDSSTSTDNKRTPPIWKDNKNIYKDKPNVKITD